MRLIYLFIVILTISSCSKISIDNTTEKTFTESINKIQASLDNDDKIKFAIALLVIYS